MKIPKLPYSLLAFSAITLMGCSSSERAPLPSNMSPREGIDKLSMEITQASNNQYAQLDPKDFDNAVDARNSANNRLSGGKDTAKVLDEIARGEFSIQEVNRIGEAGNSVLAGALKARTFAAQAQAPKFSENEFKQADSELASLGSRLAKGESIDANDIRKVEKMYSKAEIPARKRAELGSTTQMLDQAKKEGASSKTPNLYNQAQIQIASADHAIDMSPHDPAEYAPAIATAKETTQKLVSVLAIARQKNTSEEGALTIYQQNQALVATRTELDQTKQQAAEQLTEEQKAAKAKVAQARAEAEAAQAKLENDLAQKEARLNQQSETLVALDAQNQKYANKAQLEAKIQELKQKFSPEEAEVMKDGKNIVVRLKTMNFATGRSDLNPNSFSTLQKVDNLIAAVPAQQVLVEGHTDSTGSSSSNKTLSEQRAEAVKKYLLSQGLSENLKVDTEGYGSDRPLQSNKTKKGRATNRRVDIVIETPVVL